MYLFRTDFACVAHVLTGHLVSSMDDAEGTIFLTLQV